MRVRLGETREAEPFEQSVGIAGDPAADRRAVAHLIADGRRQEPAFGVLEDIGDVAGHLDRAARRTEDPREEQAERALPGAVGADDRGDLALAQLE